MDMETRQITMKMDVMAAKTLQYEGEWIGGLWRVLPSPIYRKVDENMFSEVNCCEFNGGSSKKIVWFYLDGVANIWYGRMIQSFFMVPLVVKSSTDDSGSPLTWSPSFT
jgi:hypothetical protein